MRRWGMTLGMVLALAIVAVIPSGSGVASAQVPIMQQGPGCESPLAPPLPTSEGIIENIADEEYLFAVYEEEMPDVAMQVKERLDAIRPLLSGEVVSYIETSQGRFPIPADQLFIVVSRRKPELWTPFVLRVSSGGARWLLWGKDAHGRWQRSPVVFSEGELQTVSLEPYSGGRGASVVYFQGETIAVRWKDGVPVAYSYPLRDNEVWYDLP